MIKILLSLIMAFLSIFGIGSSGGLGNDADNQPVTPTGYDLKFDISYGEESEQKLDLIIPEGIGKTLNLCVYIHGGAWMGGDKSLETENVIGYAKDRGMIAANVNYRLLSESRQDLNCNTQLQDINSAVEKIVEVCQEEGYTIKNAMITGESAGGHLALMYAYKCKDISPVNISLVYSICGPTNMADVNYYTKTDMTADQVALLQSVLTGRTINMDNLMTTEIYEELMKVSPIKYVDQNSVPTIFNSCGNDRLVPVSNGEQLEKALKNFGVDYYYAEFVNSGHCARNTLDIATTSVFDVKLDEMIEKFVK